MPLSSTDKFFILLLPLHDFGLLKIYFHPNLLCSLLLLSISSVICLSSFCRSSETLTSLRIPSIYCLVHHEVPLCNAICIVQSPLIILQPFFQRFHLFVYTYLHLKSFHLL
ncbi:hypothetical protein FGO68_gene9558 [Halteria grandinella]|uniref:Uncharacterized protein n=1 Tax=Halteria grandinella TaxID=5974 RepID=A0A8J8SUN0_HALGN|nr:hypothetical protein FGO68_gene9558 [Halteria grandinella]